MYAAHEDRDQQNHDGATDRRRIASMHIPDLRILHPPAALRQLIDGTYADLDALSNNTFAHTPYAILLIKAVDVRYTQLPPSEPRRDLGATRLPTPKRRDLLARDEPETSP